MMKRLIPLLFTLLSLTAYSQDSTFDGHTWVAPYHLPAPKDWGIERFLIPISFAPSIPYKGVEDIRFTPGWAKKESDEYWSYAFLWWLDGTPAIDEKAVANNLRAYCTGLIEVNKEQFKVAQVKIHPVTTAFKEVTATSGDIRTFIGTVKMLDYMQQKTIVLNCIAHLHTCPDQKKTVLFHELSPQPLDHTVWKSLSQLLKGFNCTK